MSRSVDFWNFLQKHTNAGASCHEARLSRCKATSEATLRTINRARGQPVSLPKGQRALKKKKSAVSGQSSVKQSANDQVEQQTQTAEQLRF